jgi:hypothetical protein
VGRRVGRRDQPVQHQRHHAVNADPDLLRDDSGIAGRDRATRHRVLDVSYELAEGSARVPELISRTDFENWGSSNGYVLDP